MILVLDRLDELLDVLESHGVSVDRKPMRVNLFWIGRK